MAKRWATRVLFLAALAVLAAYLSAFRAEGPPGWAPWAVALGTVAMMVAAMVLGASRDGGVGRLALPFALVFLLLAGGFAVALTLPPVPDAAEALWLGLPRGAAVILYVIGLLPILVVPVAYAATFDALTLSDADVERVRALRSSGAADARDP